MKNRNLSSWAEDFDLDEVNLQADQYKLSMELIEDACEVINRHPGRMARKSGRTKFKKECWS